MPDPTRSTGPVPTNGLDPSQPSSASPVVVRMLREELGFRGLTHLDAAVIIPRFRMPLMWGLINGARCSHSDGRIAMMRRYLAVFGAGSIELRLTDREFVGAGLARILHLSQPGAAHVDLR
jgi:hypothetical protein